MNKSLFIYLISLCTFTHIIRTIYEILKHRKIVIPDNLSFYIIFFNMVLLWSSWFLLCSFDKSNLNLPQVLNYFGLFLIIAGVIIFLTALFTIKTLETYTGDLITKGVYPKIRHPMYFGFLLWLTGAPLFYGGLYSFIISIPFIINILFWRYLEEIELAKRFSEYPFYKRKTFF